MTTEEPPIGVAPLDAGQMNDGRRESRQVRRAKLREGDGRHMARDWGYWSRKRSRSDDPAWRDREFHR